MSEHQFHDLRRYAAMRLVRAGASRSEAMGLLGHETESMFVRYALNDVPALGRAVEKLDELDAAAALASHHESLSEDLSESRVTRCAGCAAAGPKNADFG